MLGLLILASLLSMLACYMIARSRSADRWFWALLGLLVGPLAIPFAFFSKPRSSDGRASGD